MEFPDSNLISLENDLQTGGILLNYVSYLGRKFDRLYLDQATSDMILIVENQEIPVHRAILIAESNYFMNLFYDDAEAGQTAIELRGISLDPFKILLQYMYFKVINFNQLSYPMHLLFDTLQQAQLFQLDGLQFGIVQYLYRIMGVGNVILILVVANTLKLTELQNCAVLYICRHEIIFEDERFPFLEFNILELILKKFNAESNQSSELARFQGIRRWLAENEVTEEQSKEILRHVKLQYMSQFELVNVIEPSALFDGPEIQAALQLTGFRIKQITNCENSDYLIAANKYAATAGKLYVRDKEMYGFVIEFQAENEINYITFNFPQPWMYCNNGYRVEVATSTGEWTIVIDYSAYSCMQIQTLYFENPIKAKFVRIYFDQHQIKCNGFKADYVSNTVKLVNTFICPPNLSSTNGTIETLLDARGTGQDYYIKDDDDLMHSKRFEIKHFLTVLSENPQKKMWNAVIKFNQPYYVNEIQLKIRSSPHAEEKCKISIVRGKAKFDDDYYFEHLDNPNLTQVLLSSGTVITSLEVEGQDEDRVVIEEINLFFK